MDTPINYLRQLEEDLLEAAWRESLGRDVAGKRRPRVERAYGYRPRRRRWTVALVAASLVAFLATAGAVGYLAMGGRTTEAPDHRALASPARAVGGADQPALLRVAEPGPQDDAFRNPLEFGALVQRDAATYAVTTPGSQAQNAVVGVVVPPLGENARVIKTASMSVVVEEGAFEGEWKAANDIATKYRGFVEDSTTRGGRAGTITIRVRADFFNQALTELRALGRVERESVKGRDVTAQYVDLHARLEIAKTRRDVLLDLMKKANSIDQTIHVQNALDEVQLRIEEFQGQLKLLNDKTKFATIALAMREKGVEVEPEVENPSLGHAVDRSVAGFFGVVAAVLVGLGYLVPIAAVVALVWFVVRLVRRRRAA